MHILVILIYMRSDHCWIVKVAKKNIKNIISICKKIKANKIQLKVYVAFEPQIQLNTIFFYTEHNYIYVKIIYYFFDKYQILNLKYYKYIVRLLLQTLMVEPKCLQSQAESQCRLRVRSNPVVRVQLECKFSTELRETFMDVRLKLQVIRKRGSFKYLQGRMHAYRSDATRH